MIQPIVCNHPSLINFDFLWMLGLSLILFLTILFGTENKIGRLKGLLFFVSYFIYLAFIF
jgi:Ca2+/Na+ antiporter